MFALISEESIKAIKDEEITLIISFDTKNIPTWQYEYAHPPTGTLKVGTSDDGGGLVRESGVGKISNLTKHSWSLGAGWAAKEGTEEEVQVTMEWKQKVGGKWKSLHKHEYDRVTLNADSPSWIKTNGVFLQPVLSL